MSDQTTKECNHVLILCRIRSCNNIRNISSNDLEHSSTCSNRRQLYQNKIFILCNHLNKNISLYFTEHALLLIVLQTKSSIVSEIWEKLQTSYKQSVKEISELLHHKIAFAKSLQIQQWKIKQSNAWNEESARQAAEECGEKKPPLVCITACK